MYGPRSSYDSATLAEHDRQIEQKIFKRKMLEALQDPEVIEAARRAIIDAKETACQKEPS